MSTCPRAGTVTSSMLYKSWPAAFLDPFVGILASGFNFLTTIAFLPSQVLTSRIRSFKFSLKACSSGTAYTVGVSDKQVALQRSLSNVTSCFPHLILGWWFVNHGIPRITSCLINLATRKVIFSLWFPISIGTSVVWVIGPA